MKQPVNYRLQLDEHRLPAEVFERFAKRGSIRREREQRREAAWESFGKPGRDPQGLATICGSLAQGDVWSKNLKLARLRNNWAEVVGDAVARHSQVTSYADGVLTIRTESTVWATQLTYLVPQIAENIRASLKGLEIREIKVTGPASSKFGHKKLK